MRYLESKFSVGSPGTQAYADSWDRIFKPAKMLDSQGGCAESPTAGSPCAPTAEQLVGEDNHAESLETHMGGGYPTMPPVEGQGYRYPSEQNEGGVSGFPEHRE